MNPVIVEEVIAASPAQVWEALTDKDKMKQWYFNVSDFKPEVGFEFSFPGQGHKGEQYLHHCKIVAVIPQQKLQYSWRYENVEGLSMVTFELFREGDHTRVRVTHTGLETFPQGHPDFARESFLAGWTYIVGKSLKEFFEKA